MTEPLLQQLITQYRVPVHVQKHMKKVAAAALYLGQLINQTGEKVDLILLRQASRKNFIFLLRTMASVCTSGFRRRRKIQKQAMTSL